jgi:hypothetical protein
LKELSDLCYVTFDSDDLFAITMERAMKLAGADVGSVLILEGKKRETFVVHATYGLGELVKKGDRTDFATSVAKFAVINKSPLLIDDIEQDSRFGRGNRSHYGTKSFLCMPLKGINEVFGVLTLSQGMDIPTQKIRRPDAASEQRRLYLRQSESDETGPAKPSAAHDGHRHLQDPRLQPPQQRTSPRRPEPIPGMSL